jgi:virginiamycin B lyase
MKAGSFKLSKKSGVMVLIIAIIVAITIIVVQLSQGGNNTGNLENNSVERMSAESREESVRRFQTQFCGLDTKPQSNNYITEIALPSECTMPLGIYVENNGNESRQNKIWFLSTKNGTLYSYNANNGFKGYPVPVWKPRDMPTDSSMTWTLKEDNKGNLWFTDEKQNSLWKFDPKNSTTSFERFLIPKESADFGTSYPVSFNFDAKGNVYFVGIRIPSLWFGNSTEMKNNSSAGIYEIPLPIDSFSEQEKPTLSLGSTFMQNETVWISMLSFGNRGQILGYNTEARNFTKVFPLPPDLKSPVGITDDIEGNLWITDHGTSIFFRLNPNNGEVIKYVTSKLDNRIVGGEVGVPDPLAESSYTLPYWIQKGNNNILWFNEHTGNKIAKFYPLQEKLVEYWIPSQNRLFGVCEENEICGIANALQFSANNNNSIWFSEWSENKIGYVNETQTAPIDIEVDKETVALKPGDSMEIKVTVDRVDTIPDYRNNLWTMQDSATIKENGSLNGTGLTGQFSEESFTLDNSERKTISYILTASQNIQSGRYTLMLGSGNDEITIMKAVDLNILS